MEKAKLTDFGKKVKIRLIEMEQTQTWLIQQVREKTGGFFDSSYLHRLMAGTTPGKDGNDGRPGKIEVICDILGLDKKEWLE